MQKRTDFFDNSLLSIVPDIPLVIRNKPHNNQLCTDLFRFISAYPVVSHFLRFAWQTTETDAQVQKDSVDLMLGDVDDLAQIQVNLEKAATAVDLLVTVKNKAVDAYNEIMRMTV